MESSKILGKREENTGKSIHFSLNMMAICNGMCHFTESHDFLLYPFVKGGNYLTWFEELRLFSM